MRMSGAHSETMKRPNGFTLTELLLGIGVIAVLTALILPAISSARASSRAFRCAANQRSTGVLLHRLIADNNGEFRSFARGGNTGTAIWGLTLQVRGYLTDPSSLRCPEGRSQYEITSASWAWNTYGFNMAAPDGQPTPPNGNAQTYTLRLAAIPDLARRPMLVDSATKAEIGPGIRSETFRVNIAKVSDGVQLRHRGKANILFMDGHAEALSREEAEEYFNPEYIYDANRGY